MTKRQKTTRQFVELSNAGSQDGRVKRSSCTPDISGSVLDALNFGRGRVRDLEQVIVKEMSGAPFEDMPWCSGCMIVSKRLRDWFESEAPEHAQWIPVTFAPQKRKVQPGPYFVANWLKVVDCIDWKKSEYEQDGTRPDGRPRYFFYRLVIDPSAVPKDVYVFCVKDSEIDLYIDKKMARSLGAARFTGPQYYVGGNSIAEEFLGY